MKMVRQCDHKVMMMMNVRAAWENEKRYMVCLFASLNSSCLGVRGMNQILYRFKHVTHFMSKTSAFC